MTVLESPLGEYDFGDQVLIYTCGDCGERYTILYDVRTATDAAQEAVRIDAAMAAGNAISCCAPVED